MNATTELPVQDDTAERLISALNQDAFVLFQQSLRALRPELATPGFQEILVRFKEEEEKLLPPGTFIPVLEASRLMHLLDRWVVNRAIKWIHMRRRREPHWQPPRSSINLSNDTLETADFPQFVRQQLHLGRVSGRSFAFEIAEDDAAAHYAAVFKLSQLLRPEGCSIILTGYQGHALPPAKLAALGVDMIKLDIDLVTTLHANADSARRATELQQLCSASGIHTIAEFVEKQQTLDALRRLHVDYVQGYGIAMPAPLV